MTARWRLALIPPLAAVGICGGVTVLLLTVFNYFVEPMSHDLGLPRHEVSAALSFHIVAMIVALPFVGALADRFGPRPVISLSALLFGLCLLGISVVPEDRRILYAAFAAAGIAGAGASPVTYTKIIVSRFDRFRGLALGIALTGVGVASIVLPVILRGVIAEHGWRTGFEVLAAIAIGCGLVGCIAADTRQTGDSPAARHQGTAASGGDTVRTAVAKPIFWLLAAALFVHGLVLVGVVAHLSEAWREFGWSASSVPSFQAALGLAAIVGRIAGGAMMDRTRPNVVAAVASVAGAAGLLILLTCEEASVGQILAGVLIGLCSGAESDVASLLTSRYFGLARFAEIYALQASAFMIGAAIGPYAAALIAEPADYRFVFLLAVGGFLTSAVLLTALPKPRPPMIMSSSLLT
jgi:MFS family permease